MTLTNPRSNPLDRILNDMTLEELIWFEYLLDEATRLGVTIGLILCASLGALAALIGLTFMGSRLSANV